MVCHQYDQESDTPLLQKTYQTIAIEGNIGCGKSTLLQHLSKLSNVEVYPEPVDKWTNFHGDNLLKLMYTDPAKHGTNFQLYVMQTMLQIHLNEQTKPFSHGTFDFHYRILLFGTDET